jgi:lysophospholipase L1-like esterase
LVGANVLLAGLSAMVLLGCSPDTPDVVVVTRTEHLSEGDTVLGAVGNSLTAGFLNGALVRGGQMVSFPTTVASRAGWAPVAQPLIAEPGLATTTTDAGTPTGMLYVDATGSITSDSLTVPPQALLLNAQHPVAYHNLGVPGSTSVDVLAATDAASSVSGGNAFFDLILRNSGLPPGDTTQLDQLASLSPDVVFLWIGANNILGGATGGNPEIGVDVIPSTVFEANLTAIADRVEAMSPDMVVVGNIPDITVLPYVTTVSRFVAEGVPWQTIETDVAYVLLPAAEVLGASYAPGGPDSLATNLTLTEDEVTLVAGQIDAYNVAIENLVAARGWALVDIRSGLQALPTNPADLGFSILNRLFPYDTQTKTQNGASAFSLDGIHPSERGYAEVSNQFMDAMNDTYGTSFTEIDVTTVENVLGFEKAPRGSGVLAGAPVPRFDAGGVAALRNLRRLLRAVPEG